ncbi:hypothetical protein LAV79_22755 [Peribacillus butanolivorans]|uniref:hypothetical protein n=1 Tax=Peribacillus butanolivorans TaxID=421767 RepID=UPI0030C92E8E
MKKLETALKRKYERELKMMKEMAFFVELENLEYDVFPYGDVELNVIGTKEELTFTITTSGNQYILETEYYQYEEGYGDRTFINKLKRKTAKSIVNNIIRINENIDELVQEQREEYVGRYQSIKEEEKNDKQRIREEIRAELLAEMEQPKPKAKRKSKKTMPVAPPAPPMNLPRVPHAPVAPQLDGSHIPDF